MKQKPSPIHLSLILLSLACSSTLPDKTETLVADPFFVVEAEITAKLDSTATGLMFNPMGSYDATLQDISAYHEGAKMRYLSCNSEEEKNAHLDQVMQQFTSQLLNKLIPHWYGTAWDFNGHTETPGEGQIACGYFVSTTLRDMGLNLNRYKLAQQGGWNEARSLAIDHSSVTSHRDADGSLTMELLFKDYKDGLYFVGLDNHVGYLYLKDQQAYFINSNYIDDLVLIEPAGESAAFRSAIYVLAPITHNRELAKKWLMGERVEVVMD